MLTTSSGYIVRSCPSCGSGHGRTEVFSGRRAEDLPFENLRAMWTGFLRDKAFFSYARCADCGLLFAPTFFTQEQLANLYADMAPNMEVVSERAIRATQRGYFDAIGAEKLIPGDYLEIGPDVGYIVRSAADCGKFDHFWLFEPNLAVHPQLAEATQGRAHTISSGMSELSIIPDKSISLAVMVHVLDHLLDPLAILRQVRTKLMPGGTLMIVTHNEKSLLRRLLGNRWPPFCLQHPALFSPESIARIVKAASFSSVSVSRSRNYFPADFLVRQAIFMSGIKLNTVPIPSIPIGLKLGNIITVAS